MFAEGVAAQQLGCAGQTLVRCQCRPLAQYVIFLKPRGAIASSCAFRRVPLSLPASRASLIISHPSSLADFRQEFSSVTHSKIVRSKTTANETLFCPKKDSKSEIISHGKNITRILGVVESFRSSLFEIALVSKPKITFKSSS